LQDRFKFKTKVYDNNVYVLVQDLRILYLHYNSELNIANNMMHEMNGKIKKLEEELERVEGLKQLYFRRWYKLKKDKQK